MTDAIWGVNSSVFPLPSLTSDPTPVIQLADPVLYNLAVFFQQLLNSNLLPRFSDEALACGVSNSVLNNFIDGYAVAQTVAFPLNQVLLKANAFKFPLLVVHPDKEELFNFTLVKFARKRNITVSWVLPPLTALQYNRLYPFLGVASSTFLQYGQQGYDPKVNTNSVWEASKVAFGSLETVDYKPYLGTIGEGANEKQAIFPSIQLKLSFVERGQFIPSNYNNFNSAYLELDLYDGYNPANPITNFIDGYVSPNITITNCSPDSGTINGGTSCYLTGTGFDATNIFGITVCGAVVRNYQVLSPTQILILTNPGIQKITGNVVITDAANLRYTLANGFTYT